MNFEGINEYALKLPSNERYKALKLEDQEKYFFAAYEILKSHFSERKINERAIVLQMFYMLESEQEGYAALRRNGITSYTTKRLSISFAEGEEEIAPSVLKMMKKSSIGFGRLI